MKKLFFSIALGLAFLLNQPAAQAETKLRVTLQLPLKHHLGKNIAAFKAEVEKETGGSVKIEIYPSAQLYKDKEVPQAVASGAIEMGVASLTRFAGTVPAVDIFYVPFMFDSEAKIRAATAPNSPVRADLDAAILKTGARVLWWQAFGGAIILSKGAPIRTPDQMKGKKVRVFGKTIGDTVTAVGGAPTLMSGSKQFLAYQRGTVDAGMTGVTAVQSRKLYQVMDHLTVTNHADIEFIVLINDKVWKGLTDKERSVITKAGRRVEQELRNKIVKLEKDAMDFSRTKMKVIDLTPAERAMWRKATKSVVNGYVKNAGALGAKLVKAADKL
ncbi:MAG: TRAP transporter substrate-binding protein DctP [Alphaproteobacteria bacterium]|jgi:C4-dicarboxylate-binding protein DctP|nr:TRAP transporter substrate-binding protein DctP [Alphaproteobacteria bacterium]